MKKDSKDRGLNYKNVNSKDRKDKNKDNLDEYVSAQKSVQDVLVIKDRLRKAKEQVRKVEKGIERMRS